MAQLKDSIITGDLRVTGTIYGDANLGSLNANGTGLGTNGQLLKSTGTGIAWVDAAGSHNHDATYVNVSGDTMTGALNFANNVYNKVGDDVQIGDVNQAGKLGIKGINGATGIHFVPYSGSTAQTFSIDGAGRATLTSNLTVSGTTDATSSTAATLISSGGLAIAKKAWIGSGLGASSSNNTSSQLIISSSDTGAGGNVSLELWRGTNASWQLSNEGGNFHIRTNYTTAKQSTYSVDAVSIAYNTGAITLKSALSVANGGTGATTAADARTNLGITPANIGISATTTSVTVGSTTFSQYVHPTTTGNKHIPSGGSSGQFLGWSADGTATWVNNPNVDTKNTAGSTNSDSKLFLIGATSQAANPQTYSDSEVYTTNGTLTAKILSTSAGINANTANSGTAGGVSLYGTAPTDYGITMRQTGTSSGQLGKHGYVQGDWAGYFSFTGATNRGYIFRHANANVASISGLGHAVFNGSVTVGGNTTNTSGARMEYITTSESIGFTFN